MKAISNNYSLENISPFGKQIFRSEWKITFSLINFLMYRETQYQNQRKTTENV